MITKAGIKKAFLCESSSFATTPSTVIPLGFRKESTLKITGADQIKDFKNREIQNRVKFSLESESYQGTLSELEGLLFLSGEGKVAADIVLPDIWADGDNIGQNKALKFYYDTFDSSLGLDVEFNLSQKERSTKLTVEGTFPLTDAQAILTRALDHDSEDSIPHASWPVVNEDKTKLYRPNLSAVVYSTLDDAGTFIPLFTRNDISDYKLTLKTKGEKNYLGRTKAEYIEITFEITSRDAALATWDGILYMNFDIGFKLTEKVSSTKTETFHVKPGVVAFNPELSRADGSGKSTTKLVFKGDVTLAQIAVTGMTGGSLAGLMTISE